MREIITVPITEDAELKVNLHIIEACNMHCEFCFAKFHCSHMLSLDDWKHIVDNIVGEPFEGGVS